MTGDYSRAFYDDLANTALPSARRIVPLVLELARPASVVDVGCGNGSWLKAFGEAGVPTLLGLDGDWVGLDQLVIPRENFRRWSLERELPADARFDLAVSLEVAEHLPAAAADRFVAGLVRLAPVVLFSAAVPGQGGPHHVNEQWPAYWAERFAAQGAACLDLLRWRLWHDPAVTWWYKQNILLFATAEGRAAHPALAAAETGPPRALLHPDLLAGKRKALEPGFGRWLKMGGAALRRSLQGKR